MTHALVRTSPKGKGLPFFGTCQKCGYTDLPIQAASELCPADDKISDGDALIEIMESTDEE